MHSVAYLSNQFPEPIEPYVWEEIYELRKRGCRVVPCSMRRPTVLSAELAAMESETLYVLPLRLKHVLGASLLLLCNFSRIADLAWRAIRGPESFTRRLRTLAHTCLGAYLAILLRKKRIGHIHVHHGYFSSWTGMVASRFLNAGFSMTLHGSDLLLRADYLDAKLANCRFCITVSDFNRKYILERYPDINPSKVLVHRLGIDLNLWQSHSCNPKTDCFSILSVGRIHRVKNYGFLVLACRVLKTRGMRFRCVIAGDGEDRTRLEQLVRELDLEQEVVILGNVARRQLPELYEAADVVVLTSLSEGIPVTLMEAMAMERIVLSPAITGIPELVEPGKTGFLYAPNSMEDFLAKLALIRTARRPSLNALRSASRRHVEWNFNRELNLEVFCNDFLRHVNGSADANNYENPVLQQVQLRVQRDRSVSV
jgi:glycosyltransferase involved in cell wall biosynthesis